MSTANTPSPDAISAALPAHWADHVQPAHVVQFYGDDGFLLDEWMRESRHRFAARYAMEVYTVPHPRCAPEDLECIIHVPVTT